MNWTVVPFATDGSIGVISIDTSVAGVTVSVVVPETAPMNAVIVTVPGSTPVAKPFAPAAFVTLAVVAFVDAHVAWVVRSCVVPSVNVPIAVNWTVVPSAIDGVVGVIWIETSVAAVTVSVVEPLIAPSAAVIVVDPVPTAFARPCVPAAFEIVATVLVDDDHVTCVGRAWRGVSL